MASMTSRSEPPPLPDEGWRAAFEALEQQVRGEMHLISARTDAPPYQFDWSSSPSCQDHALIWEGERLWGGGLEALGAYLRAIDIQAHPEWDEHLVGLASHFDALPEPGFCTASSYESSQSTHPPRVVRDADGIRLSLTYVESGPQRAAIEQALARGEGVTEGGWTTVEVTARSPHHTFTLTVTNEPLAWNEQVEVLQLTQKVTVAASRGATARRVGLQVLVMALVLGSVGMALALYLAW